MMTKAPKVTDGQVEILARAMEKTASDAADLGQSRTSVMLHALTELTARGYKAGLAVSTAAELADLAEDQITSSVASAVRKSRKNLNPSIPAGVMAQAMDAVGPRLVDAMIERLELGVQARKRDVAEARMGVVRK